MSKSSQVKVTLPTNLYGYLKYTSQGFGLSMSEYVRHLILTDAQGEGAQQASPLVTSKYEQAKKEERAGKLTKVEDTTNFFANL